VFCDDVETTEHLFFQCMFSEALWLHTNIWLYPKVLHLENFSQKDIIYGLTLDNKENGLLVNTILILGKFYIHKWKYMKVKPKFCVFHNEFVSYIKALKVMDGKKALTLSSIIKDYDLQKKPQSFKLCCLSIYLYLFFEYNIPFCMHLFPFVYYKDVKAMLLYVELFNKYAGEKKEVWCSTNYLAHLQTCNWFLIRLRAFM